MERVIFFYHREESLVGEEDEEVAGRGGGECLLHRRGAGKSNTMQPFQPSSSLRRHVLPVTAT